MFDGFWWKGMVGGLKLGGVLLEVEVFVFGSIVGVCFWGF